MTVRGDALKVMSTLGMLGVLKDLIPRWEAQGGIRVDAVFEPTKSLLARLDAGEAGDVAILTEVAVEDLSAKGVLVPDTRMDFAQSFVGLAVRAGAPRPDIATVDAVRRALLDARAVVYSRAGASGIFFAGLLDRLGIAAEVNATAIVVPQGFTAEKVVSGEADVAIQQVSELMAVPGVDVVGRLPDEIGESVTFSGACFANAARRQDGAAFLHFLAGAVTAELLRGKGLEPAPAKRA